LKIKIAFIINPIAGGKNKFHFSQTIEKVLDLSKFEYQIIQTERVNHAFDLTKIAIQEGAKIVVAVGGDGTINEIAAALVGTQTKLAIIPFGSGNGLARALKIPMNTSKALSIINQTNSDLIDVAKLNDNFFFNMSGLGFDAHISHVFSKDKKRGLLGYIKATFRELKNYQSENYQINIDGKLINERAFILSIANSSQYGNEAHIAPRAQLHDGLLDLIIVKPFPLILMPIMAFRLFTKSADRSKYLISLQGKSIQISNNKKSVIHLDGEAKLINENINISIQPLALNVIVP
jgi:YegS/Rv2252/BmrU family lipid kinase